MPAFAGTLSGSGIRAVLACIRSTQPMDVQRRHEMRERRARGS